MKKKIKVLYILHRSSLYDGATRSFLAMLERLFTLGIEPLVILPSNGDICKVLDNLNVRFLICKCRSSVYPNLFNVRDFALFLPLIIYRLLMNWHAKSRLESICTENNIELIHTNVGTVHLGHYVSKNLKIPHVWHIREYQDLDFGLHPFPSLGSYKSKLCNRNNHIISITKGVKNHFSMTDNAIVIYDGVSPMDTTVFKKNKDDYFLYVGRLQVGKGIENLILAYIDFCNNSSTNIRLLVAGDTEDIAFKAKLHQLTIDNNIENRVSFLGQRDDIAALMQKATSLIVPSKFEGFGMITAEAMFNGCLVIGNNTGGTKEILEKEQLGILYSGHNELVKSMILIVDNGIEHYYPLIKKAQLRANELYNYEQNAQKVYGYYNDILKNA